MNLLTRGTVRDARVVSGGGAQPVGTAFLLDSTSNGTYSLHCIIFGADLTGLQALKTGSTTSFMGRFDCMTAATAGSSMRTRRIA